MAGENTQKKLDRIRPPRVQLKYENEIGGDPEFLELSYVVGVLGDFCGNADPPPPPLEARKFVNIDRDNFSEVMQKLGTRAAFRVPNRLTEEPGSELNVDLRFQELRDFEPEQVVQQVEPLAKLLETRKLLAELAQMVENNGELKGALQRWADDLQPRS